MKKIIFLCLTVVLTIGSFATPVPAPSPDKSAKILKLFHENFPEVTNDSIYNLGDSYLVYFKNEKNNSSCRVYYDPNGKVLETIRYYSGKELCPFIRAKVNERFHGKDIFMVTDLTNDNEHYYQIILQDSKSLLVVHANENGQMHVEKRYKRAG